MRSPALGGSLRNDEEMSSTAKTKPLLERFLRCSSRYFAFQYQTLLSVGVLFILMMIFVRLGKPPPGVCVFDPEGNMNVLTLLSVLLYLISYTSLLSMLVT